MFTGIDLYSDTLTKPTAAMRAAMLAAEVGDEQKGEDPTTRALEEALAAMCGFSAGLFLPSATMANQIAIRTLSTPGDELLAAEISHIFSAEAGGPAIHSGVMCKPIASDIGIFSADDLRRHYRVTRGYHYPIPKLVSIENTSNMGGGIAWSPDELAAVLDCADDLGLKKHLDGARLFNASVKLNRSPKQLTAGFDTVTICLSKGLGCPVGAVLLFDIKHYETVRRLKQLMGGALRQSGILAAAGLYALQHHVQRLAEDHEHAQLLAERLARVPGIEVLRHPRSTNMVFFDWYNDKVTPQHFEQLCLQHGVRFSCVGHNRFRAVTHLDVSRQDVETAGARVAEVVAAL